MIIRCVIVDDEPIAARGLEQYANRIKNLEVVGIFESAVDLSEFLSKNKVDLLFMDIDMPIITGLEWVKAAKNPPLTIFTTAHNDYAIEGYELDVVDYLLKPISFARFMKAINKVTSLLDVGDDEYIFIKSEGRLEKLTFNQTYYIQSLQNYVTFYTSRGSFISHLTMKSVKKQLPHNHFLQIHKSYIVNVNHVQAIVANQIALNDDRLLPIGSKWREDVIEQITNKKVLKR